MINKTKENPCPKHLNLWAVYSICLFVSSIFFLLLGFNSPIFTFNSENDYQWFMTMGNVLVHGKIPYRDLFEQKGPIVYFVTAFCCLFPNPNIVMLIIEILSMSLFFFFAYRICRKRLNTFYSLLAIPILAFTIFTSKCDITAGSTVEEFALPIYAYFLLCWLEFLIEKRSWNWVRSLCLGLCFGFLFWSKYTCLYFFVAPMIIWFVYSIKRHQYRTTIMNILCIIISSIIITAPNLIFYSMHHALNDLLYVYFFINITAYYSYSIHLTRYFFTFKTFLNNIDTIILFLIIFGITTLMIKNKKNHIGLMLLTSFLTTLALLVFSKVIFSYYFIQLIPYVIIGIIEMLYLIESKTNIQLHIKKSFLIITIFCLLPTLFFLTPYHELKLDHKDYPALAIADVIHNYETQNNTKATMFCYNINDIGFYNAADITPNNYFFAMNSFSLDTFPKIYSMHDAYIINQTSDFVVTTLLIWSTSKLLSQFYQLYGDIEASIFISNSTKTTQEPTEFVLLIKKHLT